MSMQKSAEDDREAATGAFTESEEQELDRSLAERARDALLAQPELINGQEGALMLRAWTRWGEPGEARAWVGQRLADEPGVSAVLVHVFAHQWRGAETGVVSPDFDRNSYDTLAEVVDPAVMIAALEATFGDTAVGENPGPAEEGSMAALIEQFTRIHRHVVEQRRAAEETQHEV